MIYVTADLHGYPIEKFQKLLEKAGFSENDDLFVLGDVIDRGEDGIELLKWMMEQPNVELILGNHEAMLLACSFLFEEVSNKSIGQLTADRLKVLNIWRANGGDITIDALSKTRASVCSDIFEYLRDCPIYEAVSVGEKDFLLVHGGLGNYQEGKKMRDYSAADLLWTRVYPSLRYSTEFTTVLGHTPTCTYGGKYAGKIYKTDTWINVDTGSSCGFAPALLRLDDMKEFY